MFKLMTASSGTSEHINVKNNKYKIPIDVLVPGWISVRLAPDSVLTAGA